MYDPNIPQPAPKRPWYKMKRTYVGGFAALVVLGGIANAGNNGTTPDAKSPTPSVTVTKTAPSPSPTSAEDALKDIQASNSAARKDLQKQIDEASKSADAAAANSANGTLPDFTGMVLQDAQDTAQAAGFYNLRDKDATGQERFQVRDSNWQVCSQEPAPGSHALAVTVTMYAVKLDESC